MIQNDRISSETVDPCPIDHEQTIGHENVMEMESGDDLFDQINVPPLAPDERVISAVACNGGISYTTVAPSELGAVPEEDEEAATSSTPSTVVSLFFNFYLLSNVLSIFATILTM